MFNLIKKMLKTGVVTEKNPFKSPPTAYRGKINVYTEKCDGCEVCIDLCPVQAIRLDHFQDYDELTFDYTKCIYCGMCAQFCPPGALEQTNKPCQATGNKQDFIETFSIKKQTAKSVEEDK